jgi:hypothetical protein
MLLSRFIWPATDDIATIEAEHVLEKIDPPDPCNLSTRRQMVFRFLPENISSMNSIVNRLK